MLVFLIQIKNNMEKLPEKNNILETKLFKIDKENLEVQLQKIFGVLNTISKEYRFDTFSHFSYLNKKIKDTNKEINAVLFLDKWDYKSLDFIEEEKTGNCVEFAILCQKLLSDMNIPTTIIGRYPEDGDYTDEQTKYLKYRHITPIYANDSSGELKIYILEPSWKFSKPVPLDIRSQSVYKDWVSKITEINGNSFVQDAYSSKKNKHRVRKFDLMPLDIEWCNQLTKRFIRVPRELKILNTEDEEEVLFIRFNPKEQLFSTNIKGVKSKFLLENLSMEEIFLLEKLMKKEDLFKYLSDVFNFIKSLPEDFWIKDKIYEEK